MRDVVAVVRKAGLAPAGTPFSSVDRDEPTKEEWTGGPQTAGVPRRGRVVLWQGAAGRTLDVLVDLKTHRVLRTKEIPGAQPPIFDEEYEALGRLVKANPRFMAALSRRGILRPDQVYIDA